MESILTIGNNKSKCQHFTPSKIVESMLDLAGNKENLIGVTVLENSFGSGNIIKAVVKRYIEDALSKGISKRKIANGLGRDIYGIELDEKLYSECIESLDLIAVSYGITKVKWQLFNDNALSHQYNRLFDLVIGNPPYISYKEIDEDNRQFLKHNFTVCKLGILYERMNENNNWDAVLKDKVIATLTGNDAYDELTKSDIDTLVLAFKEIWEKLND